MRLRILVSVISALLVLTPGCTDSSEPVAGSAPGPQTDVEGIVALPSVGSPPTERATREERMRRAALRGEGSFVAVPEPRYLDMWKRLGPGGPDFVLDTRNSSVARVPMLIAAAKRRWGTTWLQVYLPVRPNGSRAWIDAEDVRVRERRERIEVDLSERKLSRYRDGELIDRLTVGVGQSRFPTAAGTFYVWVKVRYEDSTEPYGPLALGLSGFSPVLSDWAGEGRMAIHGTSNPGDRGKAVSHGCVRVFNGELMRLADVQLGTPVIITR